jgi:glutamate formiminotransferase
VRDAEIVGLVPAAALAEGDIDALRLRGFDPARQVLEQLVDDENEEQMR